MDDTIARWRPEHPAFQALLQALLDETEPVYLVGGVVRDRLLGRAVKQTDLDLVVENNALGIARRAADRVGWAYFPLDEARDVARLVFAAVDGAPLVADVAGMRGGSLAADLASRDFTINAMAMVLRRNHPPELVDLFDGRGDLTARRIRAVTSTSLAEDPLRLVRAVRFAADLDFDVDILVQDQILRLANTVRLVSPERLRDELWKLLGVARPDLAIDMLQQFGLLILVLPEVRALLGVEQSYPHYQDVFNHTLLVVEHAAELRDWLKGVARSQPPVNNGWQEALTPWRSALQTHFLQTLAGGHLRADELVLHALLHDIGKPATRTAERHPTGRVVYHFFEHETIGATMAGERLEALRFSNQEIALNRAVIEAHMRPLLLHTNFPGEPLSRRAVYRFFRATDKGQFAGSAGVDTVLLAIADMQGIYADLPPTWEEFLRHMDQLLAFALNTDAVADPRRRPLVDGYLLMRHLSLAPGPQIGRLLEQILEAQAAGEIATQRDALDLAAALLETTEP